MKRLKGIIKRWLFSEELEQQEFELDQARNRYKDMEKRIKNVLGIIEIATDVHEVRPESWAVICIDRKPSYVKFIDLSSRDIREIQIFLKQFDYSKRIVDASPFLKKYF